MLHIRKAVIDDADAVARVEAECFPPAEAATRERLHDRIAGYGNHFWLLFDDSGRLISFVDGMVTDEKDLADEMYEKADLHKEDGAWQMIFGVNTIPACRKRGCAGRLLLKAIEDARKEEKAWCSPARTSSFITTRPSAL